jgi:hypothetical protein
MSKKADPNVLKKYQNIRRAVQREQQAKKSLPKYVGSAPKYLKGSRNITSQPFRKSILIVVPYGPKY